jgi:hypothetical protein
MIKLNLNDFEIRSLKRKSNSQIIVDRTSNGIVPDLVSILSETGEEVSIFEGKCLIDKISDLEGNPDWQGLKKWNEKLLGLE